MIDVGTVLGDRYRIVRRVGEGGMGTVYEAEHMHINRRVAVKVLHPEYARKAEIVERFELEARAAGSIGHEHIVEVMDFGTHEQVPYIAMEFLHGENLADVVERVRVLPVEIAAAIVGQVLAALAAAHAKGIVHRDLKPENVFLQRRGHGDPDVVKLLDFGISKFTGDENAVQRSLTRTGVLMGTPVYMSPEQALARKDVDHRADLYAAGVLLYLLVTGRLPFDAESHAELLMAIVYRKPPPTPPTEIDPTLPKALEDIIFKALEADREQRFPSAAEFLDALRPFGASSVVDLEHLVPSPRLLTPEVSRQVTEGIGPTQVDVAAARSTGDVAPWPRRGLALALGLSAVVGLVVVAALSLRTPAASSTVTPRPARLVPPTVQVELQGLPPESVVHLDGAPQRASTFSLRRGTTHQLQITAPGRQPFVRTLVAERDLALEPALLPEVAPPTTSPQVSPPPGEAPRGRHGRSGRHGERDRTGAPEPPGSAAAPPPGGTTQQNGQLRPTNEF
ncbi:MAG: serine/threonine protein kinase [Deltaproteobacteria bacterium]|nr:serine/threonine protein kinase [Deltaproteobacteria bacterium]